MQSQILVVSDPPHDATDPEIVASILGLDLDNAKLKIGFQAPEIMAVSDPVQAIDVADSLSLAGLSVTIINGHEMAELPWPTPLSSFEFTSQGLLARFGDDVTEVRYDRPLVGVYCKPPPGFEAPGKEALTIGGSNGAGLAVADAIEWKARLDLFSSRGDQVHRASIVPGVTDFGGLGDDRPETDAEIMAVVLDELKERFTRLDLDTRLEDVRPRHRFVSGEQGFDLDLRKAFSFGTLLLRQVLDSISPELRDIPQYEYGSRLAYLLARSDHS